MNSTAHVSNLDVLADIDGILTFKLFDKRDYFNFPIVNFPHLDTITVKPAYGIYVSQFIQYFRACTYYNNFLYRHQILVQKLASQRYCKKLLKHSFFNFCCNNKFEDTYNITRNMVKEGLYHNTVNTTLPNSSTTNDLPVSTSVITPISPIVCISMSGGVYTPVSVGVFTLIS